MSTANINKSNLVMDPVDSVRFMAVLCIPTFVWYTGNNILCVCAFAFVCQWVGKVGLTVSIVNKIPERARDMFHLETTFPNS